MKTETLLIMAAAFGAGYLLSNKGGNENEAVGAVPMCQCWRHWPDGTYTRLRFRCGDPVGLSMCGEQLTNRPANNIFANNTNSLQRMF